MGLVFVQYTADYAFIDQYRFRRSRRREDQFGAGIGFPIRYGRTDTVGVIWKRASRSFIVHDSGEGDASADDGCKGMDAAGGGGKHDPDQCLLCQISKAEGFLFSDHVQVVPGILPANAPHLVFIQPGDQGAVLVIVTAVIQLIIETWYTADANGHMGLHIDLAEQFQFCEGTRPVKGNFIYQVHDAAHGSQAVLQCEDLRRVKF